MPIQIASFQGREQSATVNYQGESASLTFYPNLITPQKIDYVQQHGSDITVLAQAIAEFLIEWDVLGVPALTEEKIAALMTQGAEGDEDRSNIVSVSPAVPATVSPPLRLVRGPADMYPIAEWALVQLPLGFLNAALTAMFEAISPNSRRTAGR